MFTFLKNVQVFSKIIHVLKIVKHIIFYSVKIISRFSIFVHYLKINSSLFFFFEFQVFFTFSKNGHKLKKLFGIIKGVRVCQIFFGIFKKITIFMVVWIFLKEVGFCRCILFFKSRAESLFRPNGPAQLGCLLQRYNRSSRHKGQQTVLGSWELGTSTTLSIRFTNFTIHYHHAIILSMAFFTEWPRYGATHCSRIGTMMC